MKAIGPLCVLALSLLAVPARGQSSGFSVTINDGSDSLYACGSSSLVADLSASVTGGAPPFQYNWSSSVAQQDSTSASITYRVERGDPVEVTVRVTDATGAEARDSITLVSAPGISVNFIDHHVMLCPDDTAVIPRSASVSFGLTYRWSPGTGLADSTSRSTKVSAPDSTILYTLTATDTISGCTASDTIRVTRIFFRLRPEIDSIDFGDIGECRQSEVRSLRIYNEGPATARVAAFADASEFEVIDHRLNIAPFEEDTILVRYSPEGEGVHTGYIRFPGYQCPHFMNVGLRGSSEYESSPLGIPAEIDFGQLATNKADTVIYLTNRRDLPATLIAVDLPLEFELTAPSLPVTIPPQDSLPLRISIDAFLGREEPFTLHYEMEDCRDSLGSTLSWYYGSPSVGSQTQATAANLITSITTRSDLTVRYQIRQLGACVIEVFDLTGKLLHREMREHPITGEASFSYDPDERGPLFLQIRQGELIDGRAVIVQ